MNDATTAAALITYTDTEVSVSDIRGSVSGWEVAVTIDGETTRGTMIPVEGTSPDCWLSGGLERLPYEVLEALRMGEESAEIDLD
jgi:hypothetical protein